MSHGEHHDQPADIPGVVVGTANQWCIRTSGAVNKFRMGNRKQSKCDDKVTVKIQFM